MRRSILFLSVFIHACVTDHNYDAISSVADNLFVIADGYTNPVRCREDLVRHGYLRPEV